MKRAVMPLIQIKKLSIEGGWIAEIPSFSADEQYVAKLRGQLLPKFGFHVQKAEAEARDRIDSLCRLEFVRRLTFFVQRCAEDYAKKFPDLVTTEGALTGFDPARIYNFFEPHGKSPGRDGRPQYKQALVQMAQEARRTRLAA